jgi:transposase
MMGTKIRNFTPLPDLSLEELVPKDNFYRHLEEILDLSFVRKMVEDRYAPSGRPSVDPLVFFKLQVVLFFERLRSERQLMAVVADRLSIRWYLGYDLYEPLPDHSSLTRIRDRYGLEIFSSICLGVIFLASTVVRHRPDRHHLWDGHRWSRHAHHRCFHRGKRRALHHNICENFRDDTLCGSPDSRQRQRLGAGPPRETLPAGQLTHGSPGNLPGTHHRACRLDGVPVVLYGGRPVAALPRSGRRPISLQDALGCVRERLW